MKTNVKLHFSDDFMDHVLELEDKNKIKQVHEAVKRFRKQEGRGKGLKLHRVKNAMIDDLWVFYGNQKDIRVFLQKVNGVWWAIYVDSGHDKQYRRAERMIKPLRQDSETGVIHILPSEDQIESLKGRTPIPQSTAKAPLFERWDDSFLTKIGIPKEILGEIRGVKDHQELTSFIGVLDDGTWERLTDLAEGREVLLPGTVEGADFKLEHPGMRRKFVVVTDDEELEDLFERLLDGSWEKWLTFLHPKQYTIAYGSFSGPIRVTGSAGTGKTVVAMHRAKHLASQGKRVLLTTYTTTLANNLTSNIARLCPPGQASRVTVNNVHAVARDILEKAGRTIKGVGGTQLEPILEKAARQVGLPISMDFLVAEWSAVIEAKGITSWEDYRAAQRTGRGRPLRVRERKDAWKVFEKARESMRIEGRATFSGLCRLAREELEKGTVKAPWDSVIVDEVQDLGVQEILLLKVISGVGPDSLMVTGDSGQRIYPGGFSLSALGIETRGRSSVLRVNYRSSLEIKEFADKIISPVSDDLDGETVRRDDTISLFLGPKPQVHRFRNAGEQARDVARRIKEAIDEGRRPGAIAVFARTRAELKAVEDLLRDGGVKTLRLKENTPISDMDFVRTGTMHRAKGLEFRMVFVIGVNEGNLPLNKALEKLEGEEREAAFEAERNLLYVAVTRARDRVHIFYHGRPSPFLKDRGLLEDA